MTAPQPPRIRLVYLPVSPFSERARWALEHHGLAYERVQHVPFLGERRLRRLVGPGPGRASVPVLLAGEERLKDSWDIALYADRVGRGAPLVPEAQREEVRAWNRRADAAMEAGRLLVTAAMLRSPGALGESLGPGVPAPLRVLLRPVARHAMGWFGRKWGVRTEEAPAALAAVRAELLGLREALARRGGKYLLGGGFSYADILMATVLQGVRPVEDRAIRLGPATRQAWTREELAGEFGDLLAWRDGLYARHRWPQQGEARARG
jgi:glutathione S-transferase